MKKIAKQKLLAAGLHAYKQSADDFVADVKAVIRKYRADQTNYAFIRASKPDLCIFVKFSVKQKGIEQFTGKL